MQPGCCSRRGGLRTAFLAGVQTEVLLADLANVGESIGEFWH